MRLSLLVVLLVANVSLQSQNCLTKYTDSLHLQSIYFSFNGNAYSHWLQPWRAYLETVPASAYLSGIGVNLNGVTSNYDHYLQMLAKNGIRHARIEIPWAVIDYNTGGIKASRASDYTVLLQACKKWGIRPLILLNAHHGVPNPENYVSDLVLASPAPAGSTQIVVTNAAGLVPGKSGICNITEYWAAQALITAVNGNVLTVSQWPVSMPAGTGLLTFTLKYRPFAKVGTPEYQETMGGWLAYADTVVSFVARALGAQPSDTKPFDLEIWNELAFGSKFLNINNYYNPPYDASINDAVRNDLVYQTANYAQMNPEKFKGIRINDGIANTLPWPASSTAHPRIDGIGKHPYGGFKKYPQQNPGYTPLNANGQVASFSPTYEGVMPEYFLLGLQVEHIVRDMAPINTKIYNTVHGRNARVVDGKVKPVPVFITENGITPSDFGITDVAKGQALKNKTNMRLYSIYLNKGATMVDIFCAVDGDLGFGMIQDNFVQYVNQNQAYPADDGPYTSLQLRTLRNITGKMSEGVDPDLVTTRSIKLDTICDDHNNYQFRGNGTAGHPDLYDRDVLAFLPYQVNSKKFIIHYYVMTRDVLKDLAPEKFTLSISGVKGSGAVVTAYDPVNNAAVPVSIKAVTDSTIKVEVAATDYPYLLTIDESATGVDEGQYDAGNTASIFPNPADGFARLSFTLTEPHAVAIAVCDVFGKDIFMGSYHGASGENHIDLETRGWPAGMYLVQLKGGLDDKRLKLLIAR